MLATAQVALAQRGIDSQLHRPSVDGFGIDAVERAETSRQFDFGFKVYLNYAGNPLRLSMDDAGTGTPATKILMGRQIALNFGAHLGLTDWLELALDFPLSSQTYTDAYGLYGSSADKSLSRTGFYAAQGFTNIPPPDASPLDARIGFKARLFRRGVVGMAVLAIATIPFGDDSAFLGDTNFTFRPQVVFDITRGNFTLGINVGAIIRQTTTILDPREVALKVDKPRIILQLGHELTYALGLAYRFSHWVGAFAETYGYVPVALSPGVARDTTMDVAGGLQTFPRRDVIVHLGAGAGVLTSAARHDEYRVILGLSWTPSPDTGKKTTNGNTDSDGDGIPDNVDLCPNEPEDKDGFQDEDGCPDVDNDQDGIPDAKDKCPNEPEDRDGFQDDDGCPEPDNDKDGIPDAQDKCPNEPEDKDGFQDDDGCPDPDNDGDGIPDDKDKCPNEPETKNGVDDDDGCPDSGGRMQMAKVDLPKDAIGFDAGKTAPNKAGQAVLDKIADLMKTNPQVRRIRIEAHTDDREAPKKRLRDLSQSRATATRDYLIKKGIDGDRLQAVGYGDSRPVDKGASAEARGKNRRVDIIIVEQ